MRCRIRCASSIRPSDSNFFTCSLELVRGSRRRRARPSASTVTYCVAGKTVIVSSRESTSPVSGSKCVIASTSSPKNEMRYAVSEYAGWISSTSPFTRKRPRPSSVSLRTYWMSISLRSTRSRSVLLADVQEDDLLLVLLGRAEAVDARDGRDDDHVAAREQVRRRGVAEPVDVVVARAVLLDVEVGLRDVRLGLVVVVVGDEVLDRVRAGRTRGTRCRAARQASCCARSRAPGGRPSR